MERIPLFSLHRKLVLVLGIGTFFDLFDVAVHGAERFGPGGVLLMGAHLGSFEALRACGRAIGKRRVVMAMYEENARKINAVLEAIGVGATGWIAGLANALPRESVDLFNCGMSGESDKAFELYRWFLPLLRMDTVPNFVQLIKLAQAELGLGGARVRPPRLELVGDELEQARKIICDALSSRPQPVGSYALPERK